MAENTASDFGAAHVRRNLRSFGAVSWRSFMAFTYDLAAVAAAWLGALAFRFSFEGTPEVSAYAVTSVIWIVPVHAMVFAAFGLYRGIWLFASVPDLLRILRAVAVAGVLTVLTVVAIGRLGEIPRSVLFLYPLFLLITMTGGRITYRVWKEHWQSRRGRIQGKPVIVLGAGTAGAHLLKELARHHGWRVVGVLDDDPAKCGLTVVGYTVLGPISEIATWARHLNVRNAILALPSAPVESRRRIVKLCVDTGLRTFSIPSIEELISGEKAVTRLRSVQLEDLLGRAPVEIDTVEIGHLLRGRTILVTGAGGSIGSELCRQIARFDLAQLVLVDISEYALYCVQESLLEKFPGLAIVPLTGDVRDAPYIDDLFRRHTPNIVFHAAAYKHVPLMEDHNAWQAVRTNVLGTYTVAVAAIAHNASKFVLVSTDKAVNPTNVMGASKHMAELVCLSLQAQQQLTRLEIVRFGNVLGSAGSVIPKFQAQIAKGGPVTVTHPEIMRYFMSIPEAAQLVLQAAAMGRGGEVFVLEMGEPLRIVDVARNLIRLSGYPEEEIPIVFTGLRPGEKLYEELWSADEMTRLTHHPKVQVVSTRPVAPEWLQTAVAWVKTPVATNAEVRSVLQRLVPEYSACPRSTAPVSFLPNHLEVDSEIPATRAFRGKPSFELGGAKEL